jgi:hypothetical protein
MSWSFYSQGSPAKVGQQARAEAATDRGQPEPEDTARRAVLNAIGLLCEEGAKGALAVKAEASGSQYTMNGEGWTNQIKLDVSMIAKD